MGKTIRRRLAAFRFVTVMALLLLLGARIATFADRNLPHFAQGENHAQILKTAVATVDAGSEIPAGRRGQRDESSLMSHSVETKSLSLPFFAFTARAEHRPPPIALSAESATASRPPSAQI